MKNLLLFFLVLLSTSCSKDHDIEANSMEIDQMLINLNEMTNHILFNENLDRALNNYITEANNVSSIEELASIWKNYFGTDTQLFIQTIELINKHRVRFQSSIENENDLYLRYGELYEAGKMTSLERQAANSRADCGWWRKSKIVLGVAGSSVACTSCILTAGLSCVGCGIASLLTLDAVESYIADCW